MNLAIYGAGGFGRELLELARQINSVTPRWDNLFFVVDNEYYSPNETEINKAKVVSFNMINEMYQKHEVEFTIAQGEPVEREKLKKKIESLDFSLTTLIHPSVYVPASAQINCGAIIQYNCFVASDVIVCNNAVLQPGVNIGHNSVVGKNSVISGLCNLAGNVCIGEKTYLGMSTLVKEKTSIGSNTIIGMGSAVFRDIEDGVIALGNPARVMKKNTEQKVFR